MHALQPQNVRIYPIIDAEDKEVWSNGSRLVVLVSIGSHSILPFLSPQKMDFPVYPKHESSIIMKQQSHSPHIQLTNKGSSQPVAARQGRHYCLEAEELFARERVHLPLGYTLLRPEGTSMWERNMVS